MGMHWQPIATAPRDGSDILVFDPDTGVGQARWVEHWGGYEFRGWAGRLEPTHWMPLPSSPRVAPEQE